MPERWIHRLPFNERPLDLVPVMSLPSVDAQCAARRLATRRVNAG